MASQCINLQWIAPKTLHTGTVDLHRKGLVTQLPVGAHWCIADSKVPGTRTVYGLPLYGPLSPSAPYVFFLRRHASCASHTRVFRGTDVQLLNGILFTGIPSAGSKHRRVIKPPRTCFR